MKYILLAIALMLAACDGSTSKIAAPQREALDKAKEVDQIVQKQAQEVKQKIENAEK